MSNTMAVYGFSKVSCIVAGVPVVGFFEGDDVIKIASSDDSVIPLVGADGSSIASISTDESATIELKLMPSSLTNTYLETLDRKFRKGFRATPFSVVVTDYQTSAVHSSSTGIVLAAPREVTYGKTATARTWILFCGRLNNTTIGQI